MPQISNRKYKLFGCVAKRIKSCRNSALFELIIAFRQRNKTAWPSAFASGTLL